MARTFSANDLPGGRSAIILRRESDSPFLTLYRNNGHNGSAKESGNERSVSTASVLWQMKTTENTRPN
jgi:hypothetical protein